MKKCIALNYLEKRGTTCKKIAPLRYTGSYLGGIHFDQNLKLVTKLHVCQIFVENKSDNKNFKNYKKTIYWLVFLRYESEKEEIREYNAFISTVCYKVVKINS